MPHLPYSARLALSNFYLFPTLNEKLKRLQLADEDKFFGYFEGSGSTKIEYRISGFGDPSSRNE
jgi:hypothetical protein